MSRVLMVEPQGEGGICHYSFCLSQALSDLECDVTLATGRPYELAFAEPQFVVKPVFGAGAIRRLSQRLLNRPHPHGETAHLGALAQRASQLHVNSGVSKPRQSLSGIGAYASRWLGNYEYREGWRQTLALVKSAHPSIAHIQWLLHPEQDIHWLKALRALDARVVMTAHNALPHDAPASARDIWKRVYGLADALIAHYPGAVEELRALGVDSARIAVIPHGNYLPIAALVGGAERGGASQARARNDLGLAQDAPIALFFGLMRPYKGIEYLLEAFAGVTAALPQAQLLLIGAAPNGFQRFERQIRVLGISDSVATLPRYVPLAEIGTWFAAADLVALPYIEASQSGVIQFAYAYRRPVIVTSVGGLPDFVESGVTGLVVPPRDKGALTEALLEMLRDRLAGFQRLDLLYYFLLMIAYEVVRGAQWSYMIARLEVKVPLRSQIFAFALSEVTKVLPIGNYFQNYVLNQSKGADIGRTSAATTLIIMEEIFVSLVGVAVLGLGSWTTWIRIVIFGGGVLFALVIWALVKYSHGPHRPEWVSRRQSLNKIADEFARFREGVVDLMNPRSLAITLVYSTTYLVIGGAALYVVVRGLSIPNATFTESLAVYFFSLACALMIPLPVDIGVIELSGLGAFIAIGVEHNAAISATLANRILSILASIVIAAVVVAVLRGEAVTLYKHMSGSRQSARAGAQGAEDDDGGVRGEVKREDKEELSVVLADEVSANGQDHIKPAIDAPRLRGSSEKDH